MATPRGRTNGTALDNITKPPKRSKHRRVATSGSRAKRAPQRNAAGPVSRTGGAWSMRSALPTAAGDKAMTEEPSGLFMDLPLRIVRPECRELLVIEARARAGHGVVDAHIVAADGPQQAACLDHELAASWLARHHQRSGSGDLLEQARQLLVDKMMQEQIGGDHVHRLHPRQKVEHIGGGRLGAPSERGKARAGRLTDDILLVEQND